MRGRVSSEPDAILSTKRLKKSSLPSVIPGAKSGVLSMKSQSTEKMDKCEDTLFPLPACDTVKQGLISTSVISGSVSAPALSKFEKGSSLRLAANETVAVPSIRPLETLHNSLTLKRMESFLTDMIETHFTSSYNEHFKSDQNTPV